MMLQPLQPSVFHSVRIDGLLQLTRVIIDAIRAALS